MPLIKAILFDLDGTLLDVDMDHFLHQYFRRLAAHYSPYMEPQAFVPHLLTATEAMMRNRDPRESNKDAFWRHFSLGMDIPPQQLLPHIDDFYRRIFPQLQPHTRQYQATPQIMDAARSLNCPLVLATNPVFPLAAILHRLNWAGLEEDMFTLITSYETMHACKPYPEYYLEIAERLGADPQDCLMIGNDADDDIRAAKAVGMKTYLATNRVVNKSGKDPQADYAGPLENLPQFLQSLKMQGAEGEII
jgi:HAD superfamily hydrolase (TIGR01509 family)